MLRLLWLATTKERSDLINKTGGHWQLPPSSVVILPPEGPPIVIVAVLVTGRDRRLSPAHRSPPQVGSPYHGWRGLHFWSHLDIDSINLGADLHLMILSVQDLLLLHLFNLRSNVLHDALGVIDGDPVAVVDGYVQEPSLSARVARSDLPGLVVGLVGPGLLAKNEAKPEDGGGGDVLPPHFVVLAPARNGKSHA